MPEEIEVKFIIEGTMLVPRDATDDDVIDQFWDDPTRATDGSLWSFSFDRDTKEGQEE